MWRMWGGEEGGGGWIACVVGWVVWDVMLGVFDLYRGLACIVSGFLVGRGEEGACSVIVTNSSGGFMGDGCAFGDM